MPLTRNFKQTILARAQDDSEFRYADKSDEVAIEAMVREFGRSEEAKKRFLESKTRDDA